MALTKEDNHPRKKGQPKNSQSKRSQPKEKDTLKGMKKCSEKRTQRKRKKQLRTSPPPPPPDMLSDTYKYRRSRRSKTLSSRGFMRNPYV